MVEFKYVTEHERTELEAAKELFSEYARTLETDLSFQDFDAECKTLPGKYQAPDGALIVAFVEGQAAGCIALRKIDEGICEMKRLYVRDVYRGYGLGKRLILMLIEKAAQIHYHSIRLDTLPTMAKAQKLYRDVGFYEIEPYVYNPIQGTKFMELALRSAKEGD